MKRTNNDQTNSLITKHVFIDTSIFVSENFFHGAKIQALYNYSKIGVINLHITTISKMELLARMSKQLTDSVMEMKRVHKSFDTKDLRIIKNLKVYDSFKIPKIDNKSHFLELEKKLYHIIKNNNINIIPPLDVNIDKIFSDYFSSNPPFGTGQKKAEFPDAFIIGTLESWCKLKEKKMYVLSNDKDFLSYKSENLILVQSVNEFLSMLSECYDQEFSLKTKRIIESKIDDLQVLINNEIDGKITVKTEKEIITSFSAQKVKINKYHIISIRTDYTEVELLFNLTLKFAHFPAIDEIGDEIFEDNLKPKLITVNTEFPVVVQVEGYNAVKLKWINDGNDIVIFYSEK